MKKLVLLLTALVVLAVGPAVMAEVTYHAVICGISDYYGTLNDLDYCDDDAYDMRDALLSFPNWSSSNITLLTDSSATKSAVQSAIQTMASNADSDDVCVFFFSGHGTTGSDVYPYDESDGYDEYLCTYNFANIRDDELGDWIDALPTDKYAIFIDTCYSGGNIKDLDDGIKVKGIGLVQPAPGDGFASDLVEMISTKDLDDNGCGVVLTACDDDESSWETSYFENGVFTYYLVEGIVGLTADTSGNDWVSAEESYTYTNPRATAYNSGQHAQIYDAYSGDLDFAGTGSTPPSAPIAANDAVTTGQDTPVAINLQAIDDGLPGALTYIITSLPTSGSLSDPGVGIISSVPYSLVSFGNQVTYAPDVSFIGSDSFQFKANDGGTPPDGGDSNIATISIDVANSVTITIGTGTSTWDYPMHTFYHDSRTQVIYLASEIGVSGTISDLALDVETVPGQTMDNWTIRMKHTSLDSYSLASLDATGWVVVYQGNEPTGVTGWRSFALSTTFDYNGTDNLLIDFSHNNSSYTTSGMCRYSDSGVSRSAYAYTDSGYGDPLDWSGTTLPTVSASTYVPNVKLTIGGGGVSDPPAEPNNPDPNDGAVDVLVDTNLTWNVPGTPGATGSLTTTFAGGNGHNGNMFDLTAKETITITGWEGSIDAGGGSATIEVYYVTDHTSFVGKETNQAFWTLLGSVTLPSTNPAGTPTVVAIGGLTIASGETVGIYWTTTASANVDYTNGPLGVFENAELRFEDRGTGNAYPFGGMFSPRIWNGTIHYATSSGGETSGGGDTTWDVYFGMENPPTALVCADLTESTCDPGILQYCTTYFWQVVAKNSYGETPGETWSFTTRFADVVDLQLFVSHWLDTDCSDSAGDESDWCFGTDVDKSTVVDFSDYAMLSLYWLGCSE